MSEQEPGAATPGQAAALAELVRDWRDTMADIADQPMSSDETAEYETLRTVVGQVEAAIAAAAPADPVETAVTLPHDCDPRLLDGLRRFGDEWGPLGVAIVATSLTDRDVLIARTDPNNAAVPAAPQVAGDVSDRLADIHPDDLPAIAAFGAWIGQTDTARILLGWAQTDQDAWFNVVHAVRKAYDVAEIRTAVAEDWQPRVDNLRALLDQATRDHADVGLPTETDRANANRVAGGLEPLAGGTGES